MPSLVAPLAVSGAYTEGTARGDLALATASSYAFNLDYAFTSRIGTPGRLRLAPTAVRLHSGLAGEQGSRLTYAGPVARAADSGLAPVLSPTRVWRNSGGLPLPPPSGGQPHPPTAPLRGPP